MALVRVKCQNHLPSTPKPEMARFPVTMKTEGGKGNFDTLGSWRQAQMIKNVNVDSIRQIPDLEYIYMKDKPAKLYELCESKSSYIWTFKIYSNKLGVSNRSSTCACVCLSRSSERATVSMLTTIVWSKRNATFSGKETPDCQILNRLYFHPCGNVRASASSDRWSPLNFFFSLCH